MSKGEDEYPHRQFLSPNGPRDGEKIKGNLTLPLSQSKSATVKDIIERDGNDIIISREAQAEISALQQKKKRMQPVDPLIKDIPVEMEKIIDPGLLLIRLKQIDVEKPYYSPFQENQKSPAQYRPADFDQQDLEPLSPRNNSIRPIHRPNCFIRNNRNLLIHVGTIKKFFCVYGNSDFPGIEETFNKVLETLVQECNEEYEGNEQSQQEETNTDEN